MRGPSCQKLNLGDDPNQFDEELRCFFPYKNGADYEYVNDDEYQDMDEFEDRDHEVDADTQANKLASTDKAARR